MQSNATPDHPQSFGYKCSWLAIRTTATDAVVTALRLRDVKSTNWTDGVAAAYSGRVFITPSIQGWVLAASTALPETGDRNNPDQITPVLLRLGHSFPEVQYFGTHRVVEWHAWARVVNGTLVRKFAYVGDQGVLIWNHGAPTAEERKLGLTFTKQSLEAGPWPDEDDVIALAGLWSIDPSTLEDHPFPSSVGVSGVLP